MRLFAGEAVLDAVRLSRGFFDLGPFRAADVERPADHPVTGLHRRVSRPTYYHPLPAGSAETGRRPPTGWRTKGRFSAAMSFADRPADVVALATEIRVRAPILVSGDGRLWTSRSW